MSLIIESNIDAMLEIDLEAPPEWDTFEIGPNVTSLMIMNGKNETPYVAEAFTRIAFAFGSNGKVASIHFEDCSYSTGLGICCALAKERGQLCSLKLVKCTIDSFAASVLQEIFISGSLEKLLLQYCQIDEHNAELIMNGLWVNTSLKDFGYNAIDDEIPGASLTNGVLGMLAANTGITCLCMDVRDESIIQLCKAVAFSTSLKEFKISNRNLGLDCVTSILWMLKDNKALQELTLHFSTLSHTSMGHFINQLSQTKLLKTLNFIDMEVYPPDDPSQLMGFSWADLKVENLCLAGMPFDLDALSSMMDDIVNNPNIERLDLSGVLDTAEKYEILIEVFLEPNRGPRELIIDEVGPHAAALCDALQHNTSVTTLTISDCESPGLVTFARGLANMNGLEELHIKTFYGAHEYSKEFFSELRQSLEEQNTSLKVLGIRAMNSYAEVAEPFLPKIKYFLALNRVGRDSLMIGDVPFGIWALVFSSLSVEEVNLVQYFLTNIMPVIVAGRPDEQEHRDLN
jgi:hypothetical protein